jgi:ketosteroid isomerase-like protein
MREHQAELVPAWITQQKAVDVPDSLGLRRSTPCAARARRGSRLALSAPTTLGRMRASACILVVSLLVAPAARGGDPAASAGPAAAVAAYHAALSAGDAAAAEALLAPDAIVLESGFVESRREYLAHHLAADVEFARAVAQTRSDERVVVDGDVAWVSASTRAEGTFRGRSVRSVGAELIVLARSADGWRIRAIHWSSHALKELPTPPPSSPPGLP